MLKLEIYPNYNDYYCFKPINFGVTCAEADNLCNLKNLWEDGFLKEFKRKVPFSEIQVKPWEC